MFYLITALILRISTNPLINVVQKKLMLKGAGSLNTNFIFYLFLSIACCFLIPFTHFHYLTNDFWIYVFLGGLFGAAGNAFLVKALHNGELSVLGPINAYKSVVGMIAAILLLHEIPDVQGLWGIILIIMGSYFVFDSSCIDNDGGNKKFSLKIFKRKDIQYRILALIFSAVEAVFIKKVILLSDIVTAFSAGIWTSLLFSYVILLCLKHKAMFYIKKSHVFKYFLLVLCFGIMQFSTYYIFTKMNVAYALALFQLSILLSVLCGYKFFNEHNIRKKLTGVLIMIAGAAAVILS